MPVFDTSALVPLFIENHPHHAQATVAFETAAEVLLHPCVVAELTTVLRRMANQAGADGSDAARRRLRELLAEPRVQLLAEVDHGDATRRYLQQRGLSFTDAVVATYAHARREPPVTYDDRVKAAARRK